MGVRALATSAASSSEVTSSRTRSMARMKVVMGSLRFLSMRTLNTSLESLSYSSQAPRLGMTVASNSFLPAAS